MPDPIFLRLIEVGRDERNLEYKQSTRWNREFGARLTKSILAMSNLRDGGHIIIGMKRQPDDTYMPERMRDTHLESYIHDDVARFVAEYSDPYVRFTLTKEEDDTGQTYIWIQVDEFEEIPVICRKAYGQILGGGKLRG